MQAKRRHRPEEPRRATMSAMEVRRALAQLEDPDPECDGDPLTRLAWRPAWSIRSRRGALRPFLDLFRGAR